jgi:hypothetical protein
MFKKLFLLGCIFIILALVSVACGELKVELGHEFSLHMGESASIEGEELRIKFIEVVEDSRCPRGVECIWAGRVTCAVEIIYQGSLYEITLIPPGLTDWPPAESLDKYDISFYVEPYPEVDKEISEDDYLLFLTIIKSM